MRYVSIDIETNGINFSSTHNPFQILSIGAVCDDLQSPVPLPEIPTLYMLVDPIEPIRFQNSIARKMNLNIANRMEWLRSNSDLRTHYSDGVETHYTNRNYAIGILKEFLQAHNIGEVTDQGLLRRITIAGKNVASFDIPALENYLGMGKSIRPCHRYLDPAILFLNPDTDDALPDLTTCKLRAGLTPMVTHHALTDALDVVRLIRRYFLLQK